MSGFDMYGFNMFTIKFMSAEYYIYTGELK